MTPDEIARKITEEWIFNGVGQRALINARIAAALAAERERYDALLTYTAELEARAEKAEAEVRELRQARRWAVERTDNGDVLVCYGNHHRSEPCEQERFVPVARAEKAEADLAALRGQLALNTYGPFEESVQAIVARAQKAEAERDVAARCLKMWEQASKQADDRADAARAAALREAAAYFSAVPSWGWTSEQAAAAILALIDKEPSDG